MAAIISSAISFLIELKKSIIILHENTNMMPRTLFIILLMLTGLITHCQAPEKANLSGKNILIVWGGWPGHSPDKYAERMAAWAEAEGANVLVSDSLGVYLDSTIMSEQDLILQYHTMGRIRPDQERALLLAVKRGVGFAGCHGGIGDSFRNNTEYQYMVGGQWVAHPGGEIDYSVNIIKGSDAVVEGINDFDIHTEQYYMHVDPNVKVMAITTFNGEHNEWIDGAVMPVVWKKYYGEGRIFYMSIGHSPGVFDVEEVWTMFTRGINWASESKYAPKEKWLQPVYGN